MWTLVPKNARPEPALPSKAAAPGSACVAASGKYKPEPPGAGHEPIRAVRDGLPVAEALSIFPDYSPYKMRRHDADEFARRDHPGPLPNRRKMPLVAGHEVVSASRISTLNELVISGILRGLEVMRRADTVRTIPYELEKLLLEALANS